MCQGDPGNVMYFIGAGRLEVRYYAEEGDETWLDGDDDSWLGDRDMGEYLVSGGCWGNGAVGRWG